MVRLMIAPAINLLANMDEAGYRSLVEKFFGFIEQLLIVLQDDLEVINPKQIEAENGIIADTSGANG